MRGVVSILTDTVLASRVRRSALELLALGALVAALAHLSGRPGRAQAAPVRAAAACDHYEATMAVEPSRTVVYVGELITFTAQLTNTWACPDTPSWPMLGLIEYALGPADADAQPLLTPVPPATVMHSLAIHAGESDSARLVQQAIAPGTTRIRAHASYEVHLGYPGPAWWSGMYSPSVELTVLTRLPAQVYLPFLARE